MESRTDTLGLQLRNMRRERGWTQEDVARRVGVRALAVGKWERDQQNPSDEHLVALAKLYGVDPRELGYEPPSWQPETPPEWARRQHNEIMRLLQEIAAELRIR